MPYMITQDNKVYYTRQGQGSSPALLLVHGAGGTHLDWPPEIRNIKDTVVYSIDLPGHGRSNGVGRTTIARYADDVIYLIKSLDLQSVVVAGYSMGGAIAQEIALRKIESVSGLILISTGATLPVAEFLMNLIVSDFKEAADLLVKLSWSPQAPMNLVYLAKERLLMIDPEVVYGDFSACDSFDLSAEIDSIDLPVMVISGLADRMAPPKYSQFLVDRLVHARLVEIDGGGHMVFLEQPDRISDVITGFLGELRDQSDLPGDISLKAG